MKSGRLQVLWILWLPIGFPSQVSPVLPVGRDVPWDGRILPPPPVGNPLPGRRSAASGPSSRHLWKAGSVTTYTLPFTPYHRAFSSVAGFGGPKLTWLRQKASSLKARLARRPSRSRVPNLASLLWHAIFPLFIPGESHAFVDRGLTH